MKIVSMKWADVPEGSIVLCPDGVQREIGPVQPITSSGICRRYLGITNTIIGASRTLGILVERNHDSPTIVVLPDEREGFAPNSTDVIMIFMRAGFTVEVLPG